MTFLLIPAAALVLLFIFWLLWIVVMGLSRAKDEGRLTQPVIFFGTAVAYGALVFDVLCNIFICTILFLEVTNYIKEPTLSARVRRLVFASGWRQKLALWIAVDLINPFSVDQTNPHIKVVA